MNAVWVDRLTSWLVDMYLLSSVLLMTGLVVMHWLRQPARRIAVARSLAAGLAALVLLAAAPGWPRIGAIDWLSSDSARVPHTGTLATQIEPVLGTSTGRNPMSIATGQPIEVLPVAQSPGFSSPELKKAMSRPTLPSWRSILLIAFTIGATTNLAWLALGVIQASRLRRTARAATPRLRLLSARISADFQPPPRVCLSTLIGLPVAIGVFRPMIVLPERFAAAESEDQLEAALAHEWAHIQNGDLRWLALLRLLNVVLFAQPLLWWLRRIIRADQEALADAVAAALNGDGRVAYAETLVDWARSSLGPKPGALASAALALWERPTLLHRRVRLLLDRDFRVEPIVSRRWRLGAACLGLFGALAISLVTTRPLAVAAQDVKVQTGVNRPPSSATPKASETSGRFEYTGRVLDPDGKPFVGAKLHLAHFGYRGESQPRVRATSDAEGRFRFTVAKGDFEADHEEPWYSAQVVATADGFGPGWANTFKDNGTDVKPDPRNLTIGLARDDVSISGRIVDLQGRPVAGALIHPGRILAPQARDLSTWITASKSGKEGSLETERAYLNRTLWSGGYKPTDAIVTDAQGRFSVTGVGRERVIELKISGPTVQFKEISVLTRDVEPFRVTYERRSPDWGVTLYYGANFTHAAAPTKPVIGVVKDRDTGKPLAGVRIASDKTAEFPVHGFNGIEATTDQDGRYRLVGLPKGHGNHVVAIPAKGQPYLAAGITIADTEGLDPVILDIGLKRGIVIEGRVTDKQTGEPLKAFVEYNSFRDNPHLGEAPGFDQARVWGQYKTEPDGTYRVVALPGRGLVSAIFLGQSDQYLTGIGLKGDPKDLRTVPDAMQGHFNALSEIDLPNDASTVRRDIVLERGLARTIRVVDPDGRPVARSRVQGHIRFSNWSPPQETPEFQVRGLRRGEKRRLHAVLEERKLAGGVDFLAEDKGTVELKLQSWATAVGRLIEDDGVPRARVDLVPDPRYEQNFQTDSFGRFRIEGLIPGVPIEIRVSPRPHSLEGRIVKGLVLAAGEVKDLGDVKEERR
ncbi:MAG: M56 family metallopeptidase [Isosphaerales bacterium]